MYSSRTCASYLKGCRVPKILGAFAPLHAAHLSFLHPPIFHPTQTPLLHLIAIPSVRLNPLCFALHLAVSCVVYVSTTPGALGRLGEENSSSVVACRNFYFITLPLPSYFTPTPPPIFPLFLILQFSGPRWGVGG